MSKTYFVAGTDTDCGKTLIATGLLAAAKRSGLSTIGMKPVAAGCEATPEGLRNSDALALQQQTSVPLSYDQINPVALASAIAPHIAAAEEERRISADRLVGFCRGMQLQRADFTIIEGAGGWRVPLNSRETLADVVKQLQLPVILVVGMKLGCLNHALLTAEAILRDGLPFAGWVANQVTKNMPSYEENLDYLTQRLPGPRLGEIPFLTSPTAEEAGQHIEIKALL